MLPRPLDLDGVLAFVRVVDLGSFTRAAEALDTSQAAISLRLKRLEDRLGERLLDRTPRHVATTRKGELFLSAARRLLEAHESALSEITADVPARLCLGMSDHVAGPDLPALLRRLGLDKAGLTLEVRIVPSRDLASAFESAGECGYDAVLLRAEERPERDGTVLAQERLGWFAAPDFPAPPAGEPLRLAGLSGPCNVRAAAARTLDAAGLPWTEVFVGGGVLAVGAAVTAGLAIAALAPSTAPPGAVEVGARLGLPELPLTWIVMRSRRLTGRPAEALRTVAAAYRGPGGR
ncbi:LysR family transcriptional regulator [Methylobacterium sp. J-001]|uniref:LysR family transcriptional regulator n=1 Tax=Methylobacterium sp. J-001 TaxID=2836609 RepID=UPI001FB87CA3|nr:LysR family transcriptional regulator [Methylobacterium sp. J-001]MCJ2116412.1 LysR family transcriptional regulator [Methylobacterium sp. J-001]